MTKPEGTLLAARYRLLSEIGRGGMGTVWQAHDELLDRHVAVKEVKTPPGLSDSERAVLHERTMREARATARLSHPGIVTVHDVVEEDQRPWIVMELVRARSLQDILDDHGPMPAHRVAEIGKQLLGALRTAHAAQILHRDVKPSNVLLVSEADTDRAVLTDFGIATIEGDTTLTQTGLLVGSPAYIAPERVKGERAVAASDLWALGATLYAACEGKPPYQRANAMSLLAAIMTEDPPPPRNAGPLVPVLQGLLVRDPAQRMSAEAAGNLLGQITLGTGAQPAAGTTAGMSGPGPYGTGVSGTRPVTAAAPPGDESWMGRFDGPPPQPTGQHPPHPPYQQHQPYPAPPRPAAAKGSPAKVGLLVGLALVAGIAAVLAALVLLPAGREGAITRETPVAGTPPSSKVPSPEQPVPAGFRKVQESGFTIIVPRAWQRQADDRGVKWISQSGAYIQVDRTDWNGDPYEHWKWFEQQIQAEGSLPGYQRIQLKRAFHDNNSAADLEFTWQKTGVGQMRGYDRGFIAGGQSYALFFVAPASNWSEYERQRQIVLNSFRTDTAATE